MHIVQRAINAGGGPTALAKKLNMTKQAIANWRKRGRIPLNRWWDVSRVTGIAMSKFMPKNGAKR